MDRQHSANVARRVAVALLAAAAFGMAACARPVIECVDTAGGDCERVANAVMERVPAGAERLIIGAGVGLQASPYAVVACYPDGRSIQLEVALSDAGAEVSPWERPEPLANCE
jgi:hypothetical protein